MKSRRILSLAIVLIVVVLSLGIVYTNAKYTSTVTGNVSASVAKYVFNLIGTDSYNSKHTLSNLVLAQTCEPETLIDGKIAPGTSGSFDLIVNCDGAEVGIGYNITFTNTSENARELPTNLVLTLDGQAWNFEDGISGTIDANSNQKEIIHTIAWNWAYETADGDEADTIDGQNTFDYTFDITAVGTQVKPIAL